ncbi:hypothetical protein DSO57_1029361 [Entomophthora muscae]|uniref:Uncharacterized protein n=1 Tax=Entomophthora muscae TaxID=34485 RepID=A0ACC2RFW8_9FUNG|nr:hypothetical protein DSO57_1029361 [Entomophthora muscae]
MTPPLTPWPNHPQETVAIAESTSIQLFGVLYITLTGLVNYIVPVNSPWSLRGKYLSYFVKLALIIQWAVPTGPVGRLPVFLNLPQASSLTISANVATLCSQADISSWWERWKRGSATRPQRST